MPGGFAGSLYQPYFVVSSKYDITGKSWAITSVPCPANCVLNLKVSRCASFYDSLLFWKNRNICNAKNLNAISRTLGLFVCFLDGCENIYATSLKKSFSCKFFIHPQLHRIYYQSNCHNNIADGQNYSFHVENPKSLM